MKDKNKMFVIFASILIVIVFLVIYLSFSKTFIARQIYVDNVPKQPMNSIKGVAGDPIAYVYTTDLTYGNFIYLTNQFPIKDEVGKKLEGQYKTFDFEIDYNEKAVGVEYTITLEKMNNSDLYENWVKVYLEEENDGLEECFRNNGRVKTFNEYEKYQDNEIILYHSTVNENDIKAGHRNFTFRMWVSEDVKVEGYYPSKTFIARVNVHAKGNF